MNPEILSQLKNSHLPKEPHWWPLAFGYYVILILLILLFIILTYFYLKKFRKNLIKKKLMAQVKKYEVSFRKNSDTAGLQNNINNLVKRLMLKFGPNLSRRSFLIEEELEIFFRLFGHGPKSQEFLKLLTQDRFQTRSTLCPERLILLAQDRFKKCRI